MVDGEERDEELSMAVAKHAAAPDKAKSRPTVGVKYKLKADKPAIHANKDSAAFKAALRASKSKNLRPIEGTTVGEIFAQLKARVRVR